MLNGFVVSFYPNSTILSTSRKLEYLVSRYGRYQAVYFVCSQCISVIRFSTKLFFFSNIAFMQLLRK